MKNFGIYLLAIVDNPAIALVTIVLLLSGCASIQQQAADWWDRQTSTVEDWLAEPGEEPTPVVTSPIPVVDPCESGEGSQKFLWKPEAENDGKAVVLLPARYRRSQIDSVHIEGGTRDGEEPRNVYCPDGRNGNRVHVRWGRKGSGYGEKFQVVVVMQDGTRHEWTIKDGGDRREIR